MEHTYHTSLFRLPPYVLEASSWPSRLVEGVCHRTPIAALASSVQSSLDRTRPKTGMRESPAKGRRTWHAALTANLRVTQEVFGCSTVRWRSMFWAVCLSVFGHVLSKNCIAFSIFDHQTRLPDFCLLPENIFHKKSCRRLCDCGLI